jgi:hypothetical protein
MDKAIHVYNNHAEMKADEYRYWRSRPVHERMEAVSELTRAVYAMKVALPDVPRQFKELLRSFHAHGAKDSKRRNAEPAGAGTVTTPTGSDIGHAHPIKTPGGQVHPTARS